MTADQKRKEVESLQAWIREKDAAGTPVHPGHEVRYLIHYLKTNPKTDLWSVRHERV